MLEWLGWGRDRRGTLAFAAGGARWNEIQPLHLRFGLRHVQPAEPLLGLVESLRLGERAAQALAAAEQVGVETGHEEGRCVVGYLPLAQDDAPRPLDEQRLGKSKVTFA